MEGKPTDDAQRMGVLKQLIRDLHSGADINDVQRRFTELVGVVSPEELARTEQQLIFEGLPVEEVKRLCDVHVKVVREALQRQAPASTPPGHPVHTFRAENRAIERQVAGAREVLKRLESEREPGARRQLLHNLREALARLQRVNVHYTRKENQLFPFMEQHGISGPSKVMWAHHDDIRAGFKALHSRLEGAEPQQADAVASDASRLLDAVESMITKEEKVLFPTALKMLSEQEWGQVRAGEDQVGYFEVPAPPPWPARTAGASPAAKTAKAAPGLLQLATGALTAEQVNLMLTHLPVDVTFVDERDEVRYYSAGKERIFVRTPAIIGRKVQLCHPPASVDRVQCILDDFRAGKRDVAEFWLTLGGKFVHIRYFAVRDSAGAYRGTIEVSQDVTAIRKLGGERRLLEDGK